MISDKDSKNYLPQRATNSTQGFFCVVFSYLKKLVTMGAGFLMTLNLS